MTWIILLLLIVALIVLRQSLVLVLAVATAYVHMFIAKSKIEFLIQDFWFTVDREVLLSIPLFMLAGNIMSRGSIAPGSVPLCACARIERAARTRPGCRPPASRPWTASARALQAGGRRPPRRR